MPDAIPVPPEAVTAICECSHHWSDHAQSGLTAASSICHGYTGSATPGPLREPCACRGFAPWSGPVDSRTGEPVRPLTMTIDARQPAEPHSEGNPALAAATEAILNRRLAAAHGSGQGDARRAAILVEALPDAAAAIAAAAPLIRADERERIAARFPDGWLDAAAAGSARVGERERIRELAIEHHAKCGEAGIVGGRLLRDERPFADLIGDPGA